MKSKMKQMRTGLAFRIVFGIVVLLLVFDGIISAIGYVQFTESLTREYNDSAFRTAETAATLVDGDKIGEYLATGGDSEEYRDLWRRMDVLCQKQNVTLIYVIAVDTTDYGRFQSVFNTVNASSGYTPWEVGYRRDTTNEEYRQIYRDIYENGLQRGTVVRTEGLNGRPPHITSLIPVTDSAGQVQAILCVERPMSELASGRSLYLEGVTKATLLLTFVASLAAFGFLRQQFVLPLRKVMAEAKRFAQESKSSTQGSLKEISTIREIRELGVAVEKMEQDTLHYMDNLTRITAERERIDTELALATRIQANMLPNIFPAFPDRDEFDIYASMNPAKEVGGDFYDFFLLDEDHLGIVIADVSGKGVPAALFMMMSKILVNNYAVIKGSPAAALESVNNAICKNNEDDMFVTVWLGVLTISTGEVVAANAGHEYPAIRGADGKFRLLKDKHGLVIGTLENMKYTEYSFTLDHGEMLFLYTDGVPEATNSKNELFGTERMLEALNAPNDGSLRTLLENVKKATEEFTGEAPQFDDLTMLAIRRQ